MQYLFQGWNTRGNGKYKDLILDTGSEEIGHVEMIATMIAQLLDDAPVDPQENAFESDPAIAAVIGGMDLQHAIVTGLGPTAKALILDIGAEVYTIQLIRILRNNGLKRITSSNRILLKFLLEGVIFIKKSLH